MEFRIAQEADREAVESLWAYCFEPKEDPFFQYYFGSCYEPKNTMVGLEEDQVLSTVHLRQYDLVVRGRVLPTSYMVGVATHPAARRGGVGGRLLKASLEELRQRGQVMTILMPSKAGFYQQYGWELYCHQWVQTMSLEDLRPLADRSLHFGLINSVDQWTWLAPVYETYTAGLSGYALRGPKEWKRLLESFFAEGVHVAIARNDEGQVEGYMAYRLGQPEIMVAEFIYTTRRGQGALLNYLYNHRSQGTSVRWNEGFQDQGFRLFPDGKTGHTTMPFMMARVVDVKGALEAIGGQSFLDSIPESENLLAQMRQSPDQVEREFTLALDDSMCPWNQGVYRIAVAYSGQVLVDKLSHDPNSQLVDVSMDVGALSLLLMGVMSAEELAFENRLAAGEGLLDVLDTYWPKQKTYINEWW